jgi:hypothetical protein
VKISKKGLSDIDVALGWYKSRGLDLGKKFKEEFKQIYIRLKENPKIFQETGKNQRRAILDSSFPYSVYYSINSKEKTVEILGVIHQSKNLDLFEQEVRLERLHKIRREKEQRNLQERGKQLDKIHKRNEQEKQKNRGLNL